MIRPHRPLVPALLLFAAACAPPDAGRPYLATEAFLEVARAEDLRRPVGPTLETLTSAAGSTYPSVRMAAVRAMGRQEEPSLLPHIVAHLDDPSAEVRAAAANAVAQAVHRQDGSAALRPLLARAAEEADDQVLAVLARSLGRIQVEGEALREAARALVRLSRADDGSDAPAPRLVGVALGMESLARRTGSTPAALEARLRELSRYGRLVRGGGDLAARTRAVALAALAASGSAGVFEVEAGLRDDDADVRRVAASLIRRLPVEVRGEMIRRSLLDPFHQVRWEAVGAVAAGPRDATACLRLLAAARQDEATVVRLAALDALAAPCPDRAEQVEVLETVADQLVPGDRLGWHQPAHAFVALAALAPERARPRLARFAAHTNPFVRSWAARAADVLAEVDALEELTRDTDPNVRNQALVGLARRAPERARAAALAALAGSDDPQLLMTAAGLLVGEPGEGAEVAAQAALEALERLTEARAMTHRDARLALLAVVEASGPESSRIDALQPYLRDFDPMVAERAGAILSGWEGMRYMAVARPSPELPFPDAAAMDAMERTYLVLHMARGGEIVLRLLPRVAPTNAYRLWGLARSGALDGLTFHRMAPNFVIQGMSPGANEYAGWGEYTRDEVGRPVQWRGTVGLSTRGRDTGDGQIYVNLVHNTRLDHDYTILGSVVNGLEVVDAVLEGDVVERTELRPMR